MEDVMAPQSVRYRFNQTTEFLQTESVGWQSLQVDYLKCLKMECIGFSRLQLDHRLAAIFLPRTVRAVVLCCSGWQLEDFLNVNRKILRFVAGIAQRQNTFAGRP